MDPAEKERFRAIFDSHDDILPGKKSYIKLLALFCNKCLPPVNATEQEKKTALKTTETRPYRLKEKLVKCVGNKKKHKLFTEKKNKKTLLCSQKQWMRNVKLIYQHKVKAGYLKELIEVGNSDESDADNDNNDNDNNDDELTINTDEDGDIMLFNNLTDYEKQQYDIDNQNEEDENEEDDNEDNSDEKQQYNDDQQDNEEDDTDDQHVNVQQVDLLSNNSNNNNNSGRFPFSINDNDDNNSGDNMIGSNNVIGTDIHNNLVANKGNYRSYLLKTVHKILDLTNYDNGKMIDLSSDYESDKEVHSKLVHNNVPDEELRFASTKNVTPSNETYNLNPVINRMEKNNNEPCNKLIESNENQMNAMVNNKCGINCPNIKEYAQNFLKQTQLIEELKQLRQEYLSTIKRANEVISLYQNNRGGGAGNGRSGNGGSGNGRSSDTANNRAGNGGSGNGATYDNNHNIAHNNALENNNGGDNNNNDIHNDTFQNNNGANNNNYNNTVYLQSCCVNFRNNANEEKEPPKKKQRRY